MRIICLIAGSYVPDIRRSEQSSTTSKLATIVVVYGLGERHGSGEAACMAPNLAGAVALLAALTRRWAWRVR